MNQAIDPPALWGLITFAAVVIVGIAVSCIHQVSREP